MNNLDVKTELRKNVKKFKSFIASKNKEEAKKMLPLLYKNFDKAAKRNVFHKNTVSRRKSLVSRLLASISDAKTGVK